MSVRSLLDQQYDIRITFYNCGLRSTRNTYNLCSMKRSQIMLNRVSKIEQSNNNKKRLKLKQKQKQLNASQFHHYAKVQVNYNLSFCVIFYVCS